MLDNKFKCPICGTTPLLQLKDDDDSIKTFKLDYGKKTEFGFSKDGYNEFEIYSCTFCDFNFLRAPKKVRKNDKS